MKQQIVDEIVAFDQAGATVLFGRSAAGRAKVKIKHGPLHLRTKRYQLDEETFTLVKQKLRQLHGMDPVQGKAS